MNKKCIYFIVRYIFVYLKGPPNKLYYINDITIYIILSKGGL